MYRETEQPFAVGDRLQFTAPDKSIGIANRELGTIEHISENGSLTVQLEKGGRVEVDPAENRHFDHGYAVTSHSAQGLTADRVLINVDTSAHPGSGEFTICVCGGFESPKSRSDLHQQR